MKVVVLAGGTGSAKILRGLLSTGLNFSVVSNVGDNVWMHGLYICPDIDIALYTLAGIEDKRRGWGIEGDTFEALDQMGRLGAETWFRLGDRDIAVHLLRTEMLRRGFSLTEVTDILRKRLGVEQPVLPATDSDVETRIETDRGDMHLQEFWVKHGGTPNVRGIRYSGSEGATPTTQVVEAIRGAERLIIPAANPVTSVGPILAVNGMKELLASCKGRKVALSPMLGDRPYSGPAEKLMRAVGVESSSVGVARLYSGLIDAILIDRKDREMSRSIEELGVESVLTDTRMKDEADERRLASELLSA